MGRDWARRLSPADQRDLEVALLEAALRTQSGDEAERTRTQIAALKRLELSGGRMSRHEENFRKAVAKLGDALVPALTELRAFDADVAEAAEKGTPYAQSYVASSRRNIIQRIASGSAAAQVAMREYREAALADAAQLREASEAERDPAARMADELERQRLAASGADPEVFAQKARTLLAAGHPRRAEMMLGIALDKGWKGQLIAGSSQSTLAVLRREVSDALDAAEPKRGQAKAIEESVAQNSATFASRQLALLTEYGVGVNGDGTIGTGVGGQVATSSIRAKTQAMAAAALSGQPYQEPAGVLASAPSGEVGG